MPTGKQQMSPQSLKMRQKYTHGNYRTIILISVVDKMLESTLRDKIVRSLELHALIRVATWFYEQKIMFINFVDVL